MQPKWMCAVVLLVSCSLVDFVAYGLAPQSLLTPLGAMVLVYNMIIARYYGEEVGRRPFRRRVSWEYPACALLARGTHPSRHSRLDAHLVTDARELRGRFRQWRDGNTYRRYVGGYVVTGRTRTVRTVLPAIDTSWYGIFKSKWFSVFKSKPRLLAFARV